jgi:SSS family solute:Na+ symporter
MAVVDWFIVFVYATSTVCLGWYLGRRQKSTSEYFIGSGRMSPVLIGISLFATLLSTISYLALPGETLGKGPVYLTNYLVYPLVYLVLGGIILPVYMRQRVTSAYEMLEARLGLSIRLLGVGMFLLLRLVWMALLVYLTAQAIAIMIGVGDRWVPLIVGVAGGFSIAYTALGGLRAVVVTDLMQTVLLYGGALLVLATITVKMGGFGWFPTQWQGQIWDAQPIFSLDPSTRVTVVGSMVSVFLWLVCTSAGDQVSVQRFMATKDAAAAKRAIGIQLLIGAVVGLTLGLVGMALLGYFQAYPEQLPKGISLAHQADRIFPHFIAFQLPPVVTGFVVAGLFAAAMSSIDSGVNSITAVTLTDLLGRFGRQPDSPETHLRFVRLLALGIGLAVVVLSVGIKFVPGNFMAITNKTVNLITVPIFLLFFFALFVPRANAAGVWTATLASIVVAVLIAFSDIFFGPDPETGQAPVSFQWISPAALVTGVVVGLVACRWFAPRSPPGRPGEEVLG